MRIPLLLAALALIAAPTVQAVEFPYGSFVGSSDYDLSPLPSASAADLRYALCVIDLNGDGVAAAEDYILLLLKTAAAGTCPANLAANLNSALLLNSVGGLVAGTEIKISHDIAGSSFTPGAQHTHALRYYENGVDNSKMDAADSLYLDLVGVGNAIPSVAPGDLRMTTVVTAAGTFVAGQIVKSGDADESRTLTNIRAASAPATKLVSTTNMLYKAGSGYYVNSDFGAIMGVSTCAAVPCTPSVSGDVGVEGGDVRLNPKAVNPLSDVSIVLPDRVELVTSTVAPGQPFQVKVTAKNTGRVSGAGLLETSIDGVVVDGRGTPTIEPNGVAVLTLTLLAPLTPGQHTVKSGTYADFLTVQGSSSTTSSQAAVTVTTGSDVAAKANGSPGVAPALVAAALVGLAMVLRRRAE